MSDLESTQESGSWRKGEFVRWQDLFVPLEGILVWLGLAVLGIVVAMSAYTHAGHSSSDFQRLMSTSAKGFVGKQVLIGSIDIVVVYFVWRVARRVSESAMVARYKSIRWPALLTALFGGVILAIATLYVTEELARHAIVTFHSTPAEQRILPQTPASLPLGLLVIAMIAPFVEEFYFRGLLLSWLARKMFAPLAIVVSAAFFALLHFRFVSHPGAEGWVATGMIATVGLVNGILAFRSHSLWGPFAVHAGYNATLVSLTALLPVFWH